MFVPLTTNLIGILTDGPVASLNYEKLIEDYDMLSSLDVELSLNRDNNTGSPFKRDAAFDFSRFIQREQSRSQEVQWLQRAFFDPVLTRVISRNVKFSLGLDDFGGASELGLLSTEHTDIYVLNSTFRMPFHGAGDALILVDKTQQEGGDHPFIMLYGEHQKRWLDRGIGGYLLPVELPSSLNEEGCLASVFHAMIAPLQTYMRDLANQPRYQTEGHLNEYALRQELDEQLQPIGAKELVEIAEKFKLSAMHCFGGEMRDTVCTAEIRAKEQGLLDECQSLDKLFGHQRVFESVIAASGNDETVVRTSPDGAVREMLDAGTISAGVSYRLPTRPDIRFHVGREGTVRFKTKRGVVIEELKF